jgi:hypothetical protein
MESNISLILQITTFAGVIFAIYKYFRDPDLKAKSEIEKIKQACNFRHANIDENIVMIKNNHLKHIEEDLISMRENQAKIFTILEERLPRKQ